MVPSALYALHLFLPHVNPARNPWLCFADGATDPHVEQPWLLLRAWASLLSSSGWRGKPPSYMKNLGTRHLGVSDTCCQGPGPFQLLPRLVW